MGHWLELARKGPVHDPAHLHETLIAPVKLIAGTF
jgi:hypothetical protein